ncbi:MAG: DNA repair protein RecN [Parabacteroides sp.]|nr:DNA repair protein RecN [Parabacteroides sp.]
MLASLFIQNFALIDSLNIHFNEGFSVITGETGAGKSIILGALGLVLGQRADGRSIKNGADKCVIEAVFNVSQYELEEFFQTNGLDYDAENCILRRELSINGKSRAFVNDSPVPLNILKELGVKLIDIHSQHQNLLLGDTHFQMKVIDIMANTESILSNYKDEYKNYVFLQKCLKELKEKSNQSKEEEDYLKFQLEQLAEAHLSDKEQEILEQEQETLSHAEEIKYSLFKITQLLDGDNENTILSAMKEALSISESISSYYPKAKQATERLRSDYIDLDDLSSELNNQKENIEFDPDRLQWVNDRLNTIYSLEQKHRVSTISELLTLQDEYSLRLKEIDAYDDQIKQKQKKLDSSFTHLCQLAKDLSNQRKAGAISMSTKLMEMLMPLGMPNIRFNVDFVTKKIPEQDGMDDLCFMFSANKNSELLPVAQTASGGEISRLMLCLKAMIAKYTALPSIIFDEVDTGVSGDIADKMGTIMKELGKHNMQVITITHLPQIAAMGTCHFIVYKEDLKDSTVTRIKELDSNERIKEIARMLSGSTITNASIINAKELLGIGN